MSSCYIVIDCVSRHKHIHLCMSNICIHIEVNFTLFQYLLISIVLHISCTPFNILSTGNVRLVGGNNSCAGRVEVYYSGEWGTVCDYYWGLTNTAVVCRELGCGNTSNTMRAAHFGPGSGQIWMDNVICSGSESSIFKCTKRKMGDHNCEHNEDIGVICSGRLIFLLSSYF